MDKSQAITGILLWVGIAAAVVLAGGVIVLALRARLLRRDSPDHARSGLIQEIRRLRERGELSTEEYDAARRALAGGPPRPDAARAAGDARSGARERLAPPGFDLTGAPLPNPDPPGPPG